MPKTAAIMVVLKGTAMTDVFSVRDAAEALGVHPETLKYHKYTSKILKDYGTLVGKSLVFTADEVKYLKSNWSKLIPKPGRKTETTNSPQKGKKK